MEGWHNVPHGFTVSCLHLRYILANWQKRYAKDVRGLREEYKQESLDGSHHSNDGVGGCILIVVLLVLLSVVWVVWHKVGM